MRRWFVWGMVAVLLVGAALGTRVTQAASCTVGSGYATIQAAVNDATCTTISVPAGTYTENVTVNRGVTINGSTTGSTIVDGNNAGAVFAIRSGGTVQLSNLTIQHGSGYNNGEGLTLGGGIESIANVIVSNTTIKDNHADEGGGIFSNGGVMTVINSTIVNNTANIGGGIITGANVIVRSSTISGNGAEIGGNIYDYGTLTLVNSIVANSSSGRECYGTVTSDSHNNLVEDTSCGLTNGTNGNIVGQDPYLGPLTNNGGPTQTEALITGSPAIDAGSMVDCPPTDQRGVTRPQGAGCDIGAYEGFIQPTATATATNTPTATASSTPTNTATATATNTATTTPTNTRTPTVTSTALPVQTTVTPVADSYVQKSDSSKNFGTNTKLIIDGSDDTRNAYLRFTVGALQGRVTKATLRVYVDTNGTKDGPKLYRAANDTWGESTITWKNQPGTTGPVLGNLGAIGTMQWVEYDVTATVTSSGTYSFVFVGEGTDSVTFLSKESANKPQLVLTVQP